jgi:hypothetical protein
MKTDRVIHEARGRMRCNSMRVLLAGRQLRRQMQRRVPAVVQLRPTPGLSAPTAGELADASDPGGGAIPEADPL